MALLAPSDWHPPSEHTMDLPQSQRQRSSPANDPQIPHTPSPPPQLQQSRQTQQQPQHPFTVQQQPQGSWTPSIAAQPFYPSFYQGQQQQQQPYPLQGTAHGMSSPQGQMSQQGRYFDPNAQLAQWAYHQAMMFNAHQAQFGPNSSPTQHGTPNIDYFASNQTQPVFNPYPNGAQGAHTGHSLQHQSPHQQYGGFHPYRRPTRQTSQQSENDWRNNQVPFQPPYARGEASGSSSSVNTVGSRQRTNSNQSRESAHNSPASGSGRGRNASQPNVASNSGRIGSRSASPVPSQASAIASSSRPHIRQDSSSSSITQESTRPSASTPSRSAASPSPSQKAAQPAPKPVARPVRPSPLSQGNFTAGEKRMSRDDSDLAAMLEPSPSASMLRSGGLKGRFKRALSLNASQTLREEDDGGRVKPTPLPSRTEAQASPSTSQPSTLSPGDDDVDAATVQTKKKSRAASLFNMRMNASTDNISLSSTVSSASVMIRKLGKLARRNTLSGITSVFKGRRDRENNSDDEADHKNKKDKKNKKSAKGEASAASISHATAEVDRVGSDWNATDEIGLSPAAKLAREHTLRSNAQAAARAKAQQEAAAAASQSGGIHLPNTWERNTVTGAGAAPGRAHVNEDGTRTLVEDDSGSENDTVEGPAHSHNTDGWDDDEDWPAGENEEDITIRAGLERTQLADGDEVEPWAIAARRPVDPTLRPSKGILKHSGSYNQQIYDQTRNRSNSYSSHQSSEPVPPALLPSQNPAQVDGLSRHSLQHSNHDTVTKASTSGAPFISALPFEVSSSHDTDASSELFSSEVGPSHTGKSTVFNHPALNSSAPALSALPESTQPPPLAHRSATAPAKRLAFANNLSVYDTFPPSVYDRRSEPATWSRLTPTLAQHIKEELNSYKMEEMEVHTSSRMHTQFFV